MIPPLKVAVAITFCLEAVLLAWLHGGVTPLGRLLSQLVAVAALAAMAMPAPTGLRWGSVRGPLVLLGGLAALALAQSVPLPAAAVELLSSDRLALARVTANAAGLEVPTRLPVSLTPAISRQVAVELVCLAAAVAAAAAAFGSRRRRRWLVVAGLTAAISQVILGARSFLAGEVPRLLGSYANSDHVALLLEVNVVMCIAAIVWVSASRAWKGRDEQRLFGVAALGALALILFAGIALTGSRAAVVATAVGLAVVMGPLMFRPRLRRPLVVAACLVLLAGAFLSWVGTERAFGRLLATSLYDAAASPRAAVWRESAALVGVSPVVGTGLGAFRESYALVQETGIARITWARAHNDYLELLISGGFVGLALLFVGGALTVRDLKTRYRSAIGSENRLYVLGVLGGLAAIGCHEFLDFGLSLPANALFAALLTGSALATGADASERDQIEPAGRKLAPASRSSSSTTRAEFSGGSSRSTEPAPIP
ncbi:MAG: O-antigen ligase family protein [Thermoanaerobaculia bacterium]